MNRFFTNLYKGFSSGSSPAVLVPPSDLVCVDAHTLERDWVSRELDRLELRHFAVVATWRFRYPSHQLPGNADLIAARERTLSLEVALAAINDPQQLTQTLRHYQKGGNYRQRNQSNRRLGDRCTDSPSIQPYRRHPRNHRSHWNHPQRTPVAGGNIDQQRTRPPQTTQRAPDQPVQAAGPASGPPQPLPPPTPPPVTNRPREPVINIWVPDVPLPHLEEINV